MNAEEQPRLDAIDTDVSARAALRAPFVVGAVVAVVCALPAIALNGWEVALGDERRLVPAMLDLRTAAELLPLLALAGVIGFVARRAWPAVRALPPRRRLAWIGRLAAMQLALLGASVYAHIVTEKNWLFRTPRPFASTPSPDGRRTAYATRDCFLWCNVEVHVREGASLTMRRVEVYPLQRGDHARLVWSGGAPELQRLPLAPRAASRSGVAH